MVDEQHITDRHVSEISGIDEGDYWWYAVRREHVDEQLWRFGEPAEALYLDLGCGTGGMLADAVKRHAPRLAFGLDGTRRAVEIARERGLDVAVHDFARPLALPFAPDRVSCLDVLEHLEDPVFVLHALADVAAPDARLVVTVPAMPSLWSRWDELSGHRRRYTRGRLAEHLRQGNWEVLRLRAFFSYCVPPAWVQRRLLRRVQEFEFPRISPAVNRILTAAGRLERRLGCPVPFGTSLIATARRA